MLRSHNHDTKGKILKSGSREVVLVPEEFIILDNAANHIKQRFALQLSRQSMDPGPIN
jgi:hypothetical protein